MPDVLPPPPPTAPASSSYDEVPYDSHPFAQTHPGRLYVIGTLFGLRPAPVTKCRVLELGAASGGNLLPLADAFPDSEFVGIDLSAGQVKTGQELITQLGVTNMTLKAASILDVDESYGMFDYVVCHGVFSWVPAEVQNKILDIVATRMNPNGIAYISYNTYPGWHMRGMIRDMMRYHSSRFNTPKLRTQQARALLDFLAQSVKGDNQNAYASLLKQELETIRHQADHYLYHEHLEENNEPLYFHQFAERAMGKGLKYLGEARVGTMVTGNFGPDIEKTLKMLATDQVQAEQYMDFLRNRMFRESLLCSDQLNPNWAVQPDSLRILHVASPAKPVTEPVDITSEENISYKSASGMNMATTRPLLKSAMKLLADAYPGTVPFDELRTKARAALGAESTDPKAIAEDTQVLAVGLLNCYMGSDLVELHGAPIEFVRTPGEKPVALPLARLQAPKGVLTSRRHEVVRLSDLDKHLIPMLDGTNDRDALTDKLTDVARTGSLNIQKDGVTLYDAKDIRAALGSVMDQALINIGRMTILTA